jgi:hypothetical protein
VIAELQVRHPYVGEVPAELLVGFEARMIDPEWQWVLVHEGKVVVQMLCAPAHGMLMILRLTALPEAPHGWGVRFFRYVLKEAQERGLIGYETFLSDENEAEQRLMTIIQRAGGWLIPSSGVWACGSVIQGY